jgi:putative ABC transport system substrate-binding protein
MQFDHLKRREFITLLGGAAAILPVAARAQQRKTIPRVGYLTQRASVSPVEEAFQQGLRDLGYIDGQNLITEYRFAGGSVEKLPELAAELIALKVDVVFASGSEATQATRRQTTTIPIVTISTNPLGLGFVASLARPGGNVTGLSLLGPEVAGKRLDLLKQMVPGLARAAVFWNPNDPGAAFSLKETQAAAAKLGIQLQILETRTLDEIGSAFAAVAKEGAQAIVVLPAPLLDTNAARIAALAQSARLPTVFFSSGSVRDGALISYGTDFPAIWRRAAYFVDRILKGVKPADLPVEQPTKFELVINLKTAKALGLIVPDKLLARADEVIE